MTTYILRRLLLIVPTLLAILLVNFLIVQAAPGGPVEQAVARLQGIGGGAPGARAEVVHGESRATRGLDPKLIEEIKRQYGFDKSAWARAQETYARHFGGDTEKSAYNLFTQNQWYAGKLVSSGRLPTLRRLIDNQQEFINAFEELVQRPREQEDVLREMVVRCLAPAV